MALRVSAAYSVPYDIEWARFGENLYLLQARPITSFCCTIDGLWSHAGLFLVSDCFLPFDVDLLF